MEELEKGIVEDKSARVETGGDIADFDSTLIEERKKKVAAFLKKNYNWLTYVVLAIIVWIAVRIRTRNLDGLRDVTTGTWTLGPDLDPFLFLRWAKYIVENGSLFSVDMMRYVPLGVNTGEEYLLHPYMMAWFHNLLGPIFGSTSVTHSAVLYPVFMFALTVVAFFFLVRKIFVNSLGERKANIIALISSFFLTVIPSLLPRTIAGIPEKESAAFLFLFLSLYFFIVAWKDGKKSKIYPFAILSGISTAAMAHIWGGYIFIFLTLVPSVFFAFLLGKLDKEKVYAYTLWIISSFILMLPFGDRYNLRNLMTSTTTGSALAVLFIIATHLLIIRSKIKEKIKNNKVSKMPARVFSTIVAIILLILIAGSFFGFPFITNQFLEIKNQLIEPATSRLIQTVAENRQPYFGEWSSSFGPQIKGAPITFWLFFVGSIFLFKRTVQDLDKKDSWILTLFYGFFLVSIIFSRFSASSLFNGQNLASLTLYSLGFLSFLITALFYLYKYDKTNELKKIDFSHIVLFSFFLIGIISARGAVRTVMMLVPPVSMIISYFVVETLPNKNKKSGKVYWIIFGLIAFFIIFSGYANYQLANAQAESYVPSSYNQQWQKAMFWVRENTQETAVFAHWWDYGYWLQSIGERATVLDGGNMISYWNHLMGRHALTNTEDGDALEFLYAHNVTHFLIDSTDIGKYSAFSFIGSDETLDRRSVIATLLRDKNQMYETKSSNVYFYPGGIGLDEDIVFELNGSRIFLPANAAGMGGVLVPINKETGEFEQATGIFVYEGKQHNIPFRYLFDGTKLIDFDSGIESGVFLFPSVESSGALDENGALMYLSKRTVKSAVARHYLYGEDSNYYKLVHEEDDFIISQIKSQNPSFNRSFVYLGGLRGPIKIWEISYPEDMEFKEEYLSKTYPKELLRA